MLVMCMAAVYYLGLFGVYSGSTFCYKVGNPTIKSDCIFSWTSNGSYILALH